MREPPTSPEFTASGFVVVRTPLLPFDEFIRWGADLEAADPDLNGERFEDALAADRARLATRLLAVFDDSEVREALHVASPSLEEALVAWRADPIREGHEKALLAFVSYFARMTGRATPFGFFGGVSTGRIDSQTELTLEGRSAYRRHTRLDMDYLDALAAALQRDPVIQEALRWRPNSSVHRVAGRLQYAEARLDGDLRAYHLVAVAPSEYLDATLHRAADGATIDELATPLVDADITAADARSFVHELIESQVLTSDVAPNVTGEEPIHGMITTLRADATTSDVADRLDQARAALERLDAHGLGCPPADYRAVQELLEPLPVKADPARLFQVDMIKPAPRAALGGEVTAELVRGVDMLQRMAAAPVDPLPEFRDAFQERYGDREVRLMEALDEDVGIGFRSGPAADASPLLAGIRFPTEPTEGARARPGDTVRLRKLAEALTIGSREIVLDRDDVGAMAAPAPPALPDAIEVMASLAAASPEALSRGEFRVFVQGVNGSPGVRLLGRFCHADPVLRRRVEAHLRAQEARRPDAVFAEIVHLPEGRVGNILLRPVLRRHEIPYLGGSGAPIEAQIPVDDLLVSVAGPRVVLRSIRLDREVIPQLTTAHAFEGRGLPVYRFLCALQDQGVADGLAWSWGALEAAPFLPRVRVGRIVLCRAQWRLDQAELTHLAAGQGAERFAEVQAWRAKRSLPRWVVLADADNELVADLDNVLSVEALLHHLDGRSSATLVEMFPPPDALCAAGPEGRFVHQLIVPMMRTAPPPPARPWTHRRRVTIPRSFPVGSQWLYAKLYAGSAVADRVLMDVVAPLVREATSRRLVDRWFFIRYGDPHWHVRLRLHGDPGVLTSDVLPLLHAATAQSSEQGLVWRMQLDTYEREVERYGDDEGIELSEAAFQADSDAVVSILETLSGDEGLDARWQLTLLGIDRLLCDFGFDVHEKQQLAAHLRDTFAQEFRADGPLRGQIGQTYRTHRHILQGLLAAADDGNRAHPLWPGIGAFQRRSELVAPLVRQQRRDLEAAGRLSVAPQDLVASHAHMHANRLLRSSHRAHELVLYDLLERLYRAQIARTKT